MLNYYKLEGKESPAHHFHNWINDLSKLFLSIIQNFLQIFKCACLAFSHLQAFTYTIPLLFIWHIPMSYYSSGQTFMTPLDWFRSSGCILTGHVHPLLMELIKVLKLSAFCLPTRMRAPRSQRPHPVPNIVLIFCTI